jgi:hypothetical protein
MLDEYHWTYLFCHVGYRSRSRVFGTRVCPLGRKGKGVKRKRRKPIMIGAVKFQGP